ncbi:MAG: ABC transporter ATP-binding protein [Verrucomicrobia bacterium]|nr:MAG: ABC transporter ATP-binding protein [Verrucomicrobiota bacterium]
METIIEARNLGKRYRQKDAVHALSLSLPAGRACAFLGRNGAGKTTTIKMLAGLIRPDSGSCSLFGQDSQHLRPEDWQKTGYVSENQELYDWMTGEQLIAFTSKLYPSWDKPFEKELLEKLGIPLRRRVSFCSRGEKVKLALLLAMAFRPRLLILDEPFAGLDPLVRSEFLDTVLEITHQNDWSIFFSTHDVDDVEKLADDVVIIDEGRLQVSESLDSLQNRFRRIDLQGPHEPLMKTAAILGLERHADHSRFIHSAFNSETLATLEANHSEAHIDVSTISLKEIFIALAKNFQTENPRS